MDIFKDNEILSYEDFKDKLVSALQEHYGSNETVMINRIMKANAGELTGICLKKPDMVPSATLYAERLYEEYISCGSFSEILTGTIDTFSMRPEVDFDLKPLNLSDPEILLERVYCQVIGAEANEMLLKTVPHKRHDDLAFTYRIMFDRDGNSLYSAGMTNINFSGMDISMEMLHERALANTEKFFPAEVSGINEILPFPEVREIPVQMLVLTHEMKTHGAIAAFYPGLLQELSEKMKCDLILLPSSVHEFIVMPDTGISDIKGLRKMVREINMTMVAKEVRLTDSVYRFRNGDKALSLCKDDSRRSRGRDDR